MPVVTENPMLTLTYRMFLQNVRGVGEEKSESFLLVYGKNGATVSRKV
jgi:hypothetical protein